MNSEKMGDKHLRVDVDNVERKNDFETTLFVGNMPWVCSDEDVRGFFEECGKITNVRVVRDPNTLIGKGFCYI